MRRRPFRFVWFHFAQALKSSRTAASAEASATTGEAAAPAKAAGETAAKGAVPAASMGPVRPPKKPEEWESPATENEPQDHQQKDDCNR